MSSPVDVLDGTYSALQSFVRTVDDERSWLPTACAGWSVRDLVFHCLGDAQRGLVALHTPSEETPDRDATTYWADWQGDDEGAAQGRRFTRVVASMFLHVEALDDWFLETTAAVLKAAAAVDQDAVLRTQGHRLTAADLMRTLSVEATIHHLDLLVAAADAAPPSALGLAEVRRTLDGLLGHPVPVEWSDEQYARAATGRAAMSDSERRTLGDDVARLPLIR